MHSLTFVILRWDAFLSSFRAKRSEDPEPSGARKREPVAHTVSVLRSTDGSPSAPLGPPVSLRSPEDDEG